MAVRTVPGGPADHRQWVPVFDPEQAGTIRGPDKPEPGYWAGSPSAYRDPASGRFYLAYRRRHPRGAEPERGYAGYVATSTDGIHFDDIWSLRKEELATRSVERFCLRRAGTTWLLYVSYVDPGDNRWRIDVLTADAPDAFSPDRRRPVLTATTTGTEGVKDPYVLHIGPAWLMYATYAAPQSLTPAQHAAAHATGDIYTTGATTAPTGLATSLDGITYHWHGETLPVGQGWDCYQARLTTVIPAGRGWLGFYDGSSSPRENYEERTGLALSTDLMHWLRLTPDGPSLTSRHATGSLRYLDTAAAGDSTYIYFEYARPDGAHELRAARVGYGTATEATI